MAIDFTKSISLDDTKDKKITAVCKSCDSSTNHIVCNSAKVSWEYEAGDIQGVDNYEIIRCLGCDELSFRKVSSDSEDYYYDSVGHPQYNKTVKIFPNRLQGRPLLKGQYSLPIKIRTLYVETHTALCSRLTILAAAGIRALIEAVCLEEKATGGNLKERIDNLAEKEVLTKKSAGILHKTRFLGNRAIHEIENPADDELDIAFDILENLLETIYIVPKKAENLKR